MKLNNAKGSQNGEARTIAKINIGIAPFSPALMIPSVDKRFPMEVQIHAMNKDERLNPAEIPASFQLPYFLELLFSL